MQTCSTLFAALLAISCVSACKNRAGGSSLLENQAIAQEQGAVSAYTCSVTQVRQPGGEIVGDGTLNLNLTTNADGTVVMEALGFISVQYKFNLRTEEISNYTGVFSGSFPNNPAYRPRVYTDHYQFRDFDAAVTSRWDGGGMNGEFVVEKRISEDRLQAHYIFQAGDHIGGTVDMECRLGRQ